MGPKVAWVWLARASAAKALRALCWPWMRKASAGMKMLNTLDRIEDQGIATDLKSSLRAEGMGILLRILFPIATGSAADPRNAVAEVG